MIPYEYDNSDYDDYDDENLSIYVLIALDDERVRECIPISDIETANKIQKILIEDYGGANVAMCACKIDDIPFLIKKRIMIENAISKTFKQQQGKSATQDL